MHSHVLQHHYQQYAYQLFYVPNTCYTNQLKNRNHLCVSEHCTRNNRAEYTILQNTQNHPRGEKFQSSCRMDAQHSTNCKHGRDPYCSHERLP